MAMTDIQTYTGKYFDYSNFNKDDIIIDDVAWSLNMNCRFNGHCTRFYSVAHHLCLVHDLMLHTMNELHSPQQILGRALTDVDCFHGLVHDVGEAYMTDIPRPLKNYLTLAPAAKGFMDEYLKLESQIVDCFCEKYNMPVMSVESEKIVKYFDVWALLIEQKYLMSKTSKSWDVQSQSFPTEPDWVKDMMTTNLNWADELKGRLYIYGDIS